MGEVYAIIVACGLMNGTTDCIMLQQQGSPVREYQCAEKISELLLDFEVMRRQVPQFKDYVVVDKICSKESMPHGSKPKEEET